MRAKWLLRKILRWWPHRRATRGRWALRIKGLGKESFLCHIYARVGIIAKDPSIKPSKAQPGRRPLEMLKLSAPELDGSPSFPASPLLSAVCL